jgi:transcriptional regulator with GAF, ATPase, and Fis domain
MVVSLDDRPSADPRSIARVLSEVAQIASETLELQDVFHRVASSIREVIPFEHMGVMRILEGHRAVMHATTVTGCGEGECSSPLPLDFWSPRLRPRPGPNPRIDDAVTELDPSFPGDAEILATGVRSAMWEPFGNGDGFSGGVWISSYLPRAFHDDHQRILHPIAALMGTAVEHWRIWDADRRRRDRLDRIEPLLGTLAEALDVRDVFGRISEAMKPILPHDLLVLSELDLRQRTLRLAAVAGSADGPVPTEPVTLTEEELERRAQDFEILHDIPAELTPGSEREQRLVASGMRSWLRVPVRMAGEVRAGIGFFHREPSRYGADDVEVASRFADRVALMLSHQRLAEEARVAAEARDRAERLAATVQTLTRELERRRQSRVVGMSRSWRETLRQVGLVAPSETTVLITGESGTGKEVVSRLIHHGSPRADRPFVAINCAALPEQLLESELFGHDKGAFTGATGTKVGLIEQAAGGTLFLDEIAEMSPRVQAKFLRVLQEREFQRVGGTRTLRADVRVIAATNRDLHAALDRGAFREDLYYRLNVFGIHVASLRERPEDILVLAETFLEDLGGTVARPAAGISRDAREWLLAHTWPGNVRELRNAIERAILLCDGGLITREHLPAATARLAEPGPDGARLHGRARNRAAHEAMRGNGSARSEGAAGAAAAESVDLGTMERALIERALAQSGGNKSQAARLLGLTRSQLYSRLERYSLH